MSGERVARVVAVVLLGAVVLLAAAGQRGAEYDEQYTLFLTGGTARPSWTDASITAGEVRALQDGHAGFAAIARDLRATDVHPPLYFWAVALWRRWFGGGLFAARTLSVLSSVVSLALVAVIARRCGIAAWLAVLLTVGCYGFVYTGSIARGFALAQMLTLAGVAVAASPMSRIPGAVAAGLLLGAATFSNYLTAFVACAVLMWLPGRRRIAAAAGSAVWLPADAWFFLAQRQSRTGQFVPFEAGAAVVRLMRYAAASVFGGLPLYLGDLAGHVLAVALAVLLLVLLAMLASRWRRAHALFGMACVAPLMGLLLLGLTFNNTPIELRYVAFATPFIGLLLATLPRPVCWLVLAIQAVSLAGLMTRPETMQPARATAAAIEPLLHDGVVLLPRGNDGVGIVGALANEMPPATQLMIIRRDDTPQQIRRRAAVYTRVVLALIAQDADSRATLPHMRAAFEDECWRAAGRDGDAVAFERVCAVE